MRPRRQTLVRGPVHQAPKCNHPGSRKLRLALGARTTGQPSLTSEHPAALAASGNGTTRLSGRRHDSLPRISVLATVAPLKRSSTSKCAHRDRCARASRHPERQECT